MEDNIEHIGFWCIDNNHPLRNNKYLDEELKDDKTSYTTDDIIKWRRDYGIMNESKNKYPIQYDEIIYKNNE